MLLVILDNPGYSRHNAVINPRKFVLRDGRRRNLLENLVKISILKIILLMTALLLALTACAPQATAEPTAVPTEIPTETPQPTPTETATPEPTATLDPTLVAASATAAAPTSAPVVVQAVEDQATWISQTLNDGYQVRPNTVLAITWSVKNTGPTLWTTGYSLRQYAGPDIGKAYQALAKAVAANETAQITVTFTTPAVPGEYNLWYKIANEQGVNFGDVNFVFTVTNTPGLSTATATP